MYPGSAQVKGEPPAQGSRLVAGHMTVIDANTAHFDAAGMPTMEFVPTGKTSPGCA